MKYVKAALLSNLVMRSTFGVDRHETIFVLKAGYAGRDTTPGTGIDHTAEIWKELFLRNS